MVAFLCGAIFSGLSEWFLGCGSGVYVFGVVVWWLLGGFLV